MPAAAAAWQSLADELTLAAAGYGSVVSSVAGGPTGPSSTSMAAAAAPYVAWLSATGDQAQQPAVQVAAAASAVGLASGTGALGSTGIAGFGTGARQSPRVWVRRPGPVLCPCRPRGPAQLRG
jgi:PPE-repeat protein